MVDGAVWGKSMPCVDGVNRALEISMGIKGLIPVLVRHLMLVNNITAQCWCHNLMTKFRRPFTNARENSFKDINGRTNFTQVFSSAISSTALFNKCNFAGSFNLISGF